MLIYLLIEIINQKNEKTIEFRYKNIVKLKVIKQCITKGYVDQESGSDNHIIRNNKYNNNLLIEQRLSKIIRYAYN